MSTEPTKPRDAQAPAAGNVSPDLPDHVTRPASIESLAGDSPIKSPQDDAFGIDPFAAAIARSIARADAGEGIVYAVNGAWGSGKSSVMNLILHHLSEDINAEKIVPISFNPWWFSGAEALTISFFQEMGATIGKSLDEKAREAMASIGSRLSSAGPLLGGIASLFASPAAGAAVTGGAALIEKLTRLDSTVEKEHRKIAAALSAQGKRLLIVLDDIDRLNTDDALQVFKLIKSVGRLPNVIYLMAFDRHLAEKMVAERFPAEGAGYLEKVIQGAFDVPNPDPDDLKMLLLRTIEEVMGAPPKEKFTRFWNLFYDVVTPLLKTPRDVVRLGNAIKVSWPAVTENVDRADFVAIESLRIFMPSVYQTVRAHPDMLTGRQSRLRHDRQALESQYNQTFLAALADRDREIAKRALRRMFPRLNAIWNNSWQEDSNSWQRDRLICSPNHFRTYFAFGVTDEGITWEESSALIANAGIAGATESKLRKCLASARRKGGTRAALALDELTVRAGDIAENDVLTFLTDVFSIVDELDVPADDAGRKSFGIESNNVRVHWLVNNLVRDRFDFAERSRLLRQAASHASFGWLISISDRCKSDFDKAEQGNPAREEPLVDKETAVWLCDLSLSRIRASADDGTLAAHRDLGSMLFRWKDRTGSEEVRQWTQRQLADDRFIIAIAKNLVQESWSNGMGGFGFLGDRVARRTEYVNTKPYRELIDVGTFRERVASLLTSEGLDTSQRSILERFQSTPDGDPNRVKSDS